MIKKINLILSLVLSLLVSFLAIKIDAFYKIYIIILLFLGFYIALTAFWFAFIFIFSLFINMKKEYHEQNFVIDKIVTLTMEFLLNLSHTRVIFEGKDLIPNDERFLLVYNHTSNFDPIVINAILNKSKIIHISKPENFKIPIAGPFVYRNCYMAIDRNNDRKALVTIQKAIDYVEERKFSIGIAPEGTRNKHNPKELLPFKEGCFKIATKSNCKIIVCLLENVEQIHKNFPFRRTKVKMKVLKVLSSDDYKDLNTLEISKNVRNLMQEELNKKEEI